MIAFALCLIASASAFGPACPVNKPSASPATNNDVPINYKIAFIGDQALGINPTTVLRQLQQWGVQAIYHQGDFDYEDDPEAWDEQITSVLGANFPYFAALGNHDILAQRGYQQVLNARLARIPGAECTGDTGLSSVCFFNGVLVTLTGMGLAGEGHEEYVDEIFADNPDIVWKFCGWHNNHHDYQVGDKPTSVSLELYDACRRHGAIVATRHEHSYGRTHLMSSFANYEVVNELNNLQVTEGNSFVFCQGLGGRDIRDYSGNEDEDWWAATAAGDDGVDYGPLYCTLNVNGNLGSAQCFFQDISGQVWDNFTITNTNGRNPATRGGIKKPACGPHNVQAIDTHGQGETVVSAESAVTLAFAMNVQRGEIIEEAYLEVLGRATSLTRADAVVVATFASGSLPIAETQWNMTLTELDEPVWKSSDVAAQLQSLVDADGWVAGSQVTVTLWIPRKAAAQGKFMAFANSVDDRCLAPTLSIFLKNHCYLKSASK